MPKLHYFRKELLSNPVLVKGQRVPFEPLSNNRGVIVLDEEKPEHAAFIADLKELALKHKFGVVAINAEEYEAQKKTNPPVIPSVKKKSEKLRVMQPLLKRGSTSPEKAVPAASGRRAIPVANPPANKSETAATTTPPAPATGSASTPAFVPRTAPKPEPSAQAQS